MVYCADGSGDGTRQLIALLTLALVTSACAEPSAPLEPCGPLSVRVASGPPLEFTWTPRCGVTDVAVFAESEPDILLWHVGVPREPLIGPGVTYGVTPTGAQLRVPPVELQPGTNYVVWLLYAVEDGATGLGSLTFSP